MLNPGDVNVSEMRINPFSLTFYENNLERKYLYFRVPTSLKLFKWAYILTILLFGAYSLLDTILVEEKSVMYE